MPTSELTVVVDGGGSLATPLLEGLVSSAAFGSVIWRRPQLFSEVEAPRPVRVLSVRRRPDADLVVDLDWRAQDGRDRSRVLDALGFSLIHSLDPTDALGCLLAKHGAPSLDTVDEVRTATYWGSGRPFSRRGFPGRATFEWRSKALVWRRAWSGRELVSFPEPIGARDCRLAAGTTPSALIAEFPGASRLAVRVGGPPFFPNRPRHRMAAGLISVVVELRGTCNGSVEYRVLGLIGPIATVKTAILLTAARFAARRIASSAPNPHPGSAQSFANLGDTAELMDSLSGYGCTLVAFGPTDSPKENPEGAKSP